MIDLQLDIDEGIVLQTTEAIRYADEDVEDSIEEMILTNKNIFYSYEYKSGMFAKAEVIVEKIPLEKIKVVNGKVQIMKINHEDYGNVMQVLYVDGKREFFEFWDNKKELPKWMNAINCAITGDSTPIIEEIKKFYVNAKELLEKILEDDEYNLEALKEYVKSMKEASNQR